MLLCLDTAPVFSISGWQWRRSTALITTAGSCYNPVESLLRIPCCYHSIPGYIILFTRLGSDLALGVI